MAMSEKTLNLLRGGLAFQQAGNLEAAESAYRSVLKREPMQFDALHMLAVLLTARSDYQVAAKLIERALLVNPKSVRARVNYGNILRNLGRYSEALSEHEQAIRIQPDFMGAWHNKGNVLSDMKRFEEALDSYSKALEIDASVPAVVNDRGTVLMELHRYSDALRHFDGAIHLSPDFSMAHFNRGKVLRKLSRPEEAVNSFNEAIRLDAGNADAYWNRGCVFEEFGRVDEAIEDYKAALILAPNKPFRFGLLLHAKRVGCYWDSYFKEHADLCEMIGKGNLCSEPFSFLAVNSDPSMQKKCAEAWGMFEHPPKVADLGEIVRHKSSGKIRLAYFSSDFRMHAVSILSARVFELHDRSRFDVIAFSFGPPVDDDYRQRLKSSFDDFLEVENLSDHEMALLAREKKIDIVVNLNGFTQFERTGALSYRCAPIQVSFLGFPATMGVDYIDYIIADEVVVPRGDEEFFSEKIVRLPWSYMPADPTREISEKKIKRSDFGLPEDGFVFCCFNNSYKFSPDSFDVWMELLKDNPTSVLWLAKPNAVAENNLRLEATLRGVDSSRLVFAPRMDALPEHLARLRLADLFLDTFHFNAHTTACDALWAGLPVLTLPGKTFTSRVAASLLRAVGLSELVAESVEGYRALANRLSSNTQELKRLRDRLWENRLTTPLFCAENYTRGLEKAFEAMLDRHLALLPPDNIDVPV